MEESTTGKAVAAAATGFGCVAWLAFGVVEVTALFATWGTGHFWAALFFPPYGLWITIAWIFGLPPFPL